MATANELKCPLCCTDTFDSPQSLKYHLLSIIDNLLCPKCGSRFQTVLELVEHLETDCLTYVEFISELESSTQIEELATEQIIDDEDKRYRCVTCGINFMSFPAHISKYHAGEDIVLRIPETEEIDLMQQQKGGNDYPNIPEQILVDNFNVVEENRNDTKKYPNEYKLSLSPQTLKCIHKGKCVDQEGRPFTRKIIKIEKFWEDSLEEQKNAVVVDYVVEIDGSLTKISSDQLVKDHMNKMQILKCGQCSMQFSKREHFDVHACAPEIVSEYQCSDCNASFTESPSLCEHMSLHKMKKKKLNGNSSSAKDFLCTLCETVFQSNKSLRLHMRMHNAIAPKEVEVPVDYGSKEESTSKTQNPDIFYCNICEKHYDKNYENTHMGFHNQENSFLCSICNKNFDSENNLEVHLKVHTDKNGNECLSCKKRFPTEESLEEHFEQEGCNKPYKCNFCSCRFSRANEKVKHQRIHTGEKPYECEVCGKRFRVSSCLTLHLRTHSNYRPYVCKICSKRFKGHSAFKLHELTHSDERRYKCSDCPKSFKTRVQLAGHKNSHTKPYNCTHCTRRFSSLYSVKAHIRTHTDENKISYICNICNASYARPAALTEHIHRAHTTAQENNILFDIIIDGVEPIGSISSDNVSSASSAASFTED